MKNQIGKLVGLTSLFVLGLVFGQSTNIMIDFASAQPVEDSRNNLWFLISVRESLERKDTANAEDLINVKINDELTHLRHDRNRALVVSKDSTWRKYLSTIQRIWNTSPPFESGKFKLQASQDWYAEFSKEHIENRKFVEEVLSENRRSR